MIENLTDGNNEVKQKNKDLFDEPFNKINEVDDLKVKIGENSLTSSGSSFSEELQKLYKFKCSKGCC